ncbi:putative transporter [Acrodontium crateriforme]|uniref:Transporter n=1 Tax=Acrodontium crateriforme TaxID=150365 RepID=A0AAQ3MCB5_9PEZI|nr:putative transporter [Acrodontium crateriforme]
MKELKPEVGLEVVSEPAPFDHLVTWESTDDPLNPLNWPQYRKWTVTILVSLGSFVTLMSGSMIAPALPELSRDLHKSEATAALTLSIFILAFGFAPLVLAPLTEVWGRRPVWLVCGVLYSVWSVVCGVAPNKATLVAARLLAGISGSVDFVMSYPVSWDIWTPEQRGRGLAIASILPVLGPAIGPIVGGIIADTIGWRWIFHWAAVFNGCVIIAAFFFFPETSASQILRLKARKLRKETHDQSFYTVDDKKRAKLSSRLSSSLKRPIKLLLTQPILQLVSIFTAYNFGLLYISGLHYLALAVGYTVANQAGAVMMDKTWVYLKKRHGGGETEGGSVAPEYRLPLLIPGSLLVPIGLLWFGWSAASKIHWIMCDVGAALFGCGFILSTKALLSYNFDCYPKHTASASAAGQFLRMIAGFAFPIFAPAMYHRLGWGWANTVLALLAVLFAISGPLILWKFGARIRALGKDLE